MRTTFFISLLVFLMRAIGVAGDWPSWRGPQSNGVSHATELPAKWEAGTNIRWRLPLPGPGPSTPIVTGDRIFLTAGDGDNLMLLGIGTNGKIRWRQDVTSGDKDVRQGESNMAAPSPVTDGEKVWAFFGTGDLICTDLDGNILWQKDLEDDYRKFNLYWEMATSPLLDGDRLYLQLLHTNTQSVIALDKNSGDEVWHHQRKTNAASESLHAYASPILYRHDDDAYLVTHGADYVVGHSLKDGSELWRCGGLQGGRYNPMLRFVASPVAYENIIVVPSAKNGPILAIDGTSAAGDITGGESVIWRRSKHTPDVPSPVVHDGLAYFCRENGQLLCLDVKTGEEVYFKRVIRERHRGSPVYADGKLYLSSMEGTISVVKAGRKYELLAQNRMQEQIAASPAVANRTIYIRTYAALYAITAE